jgi:hypothetical protein
MKQMIYKNMGKPAANLTHGLVYNVIGEHQDGCGNKLYSVVDDFEDVAVIPASMVEKEWWLNNGQRAELPLETGCKVSWKEMKGRNVQNV